jgi:allantoinase
MALPPHRIDYLPSIDRPAIEWPDGARVAFWVAPNIEHYEFLPPRDPQRNPWPRSPHPDVQGYSQRDYGNRVGFWRMLEAIDEYDIRCTASTNLSVYEHYPEVSQAMTERSWEIMSHGVYNTRYISSLSPDDERAFYAETIEALHRHTGARLRGMLGPAVSNSTATPDLMAEAGLTYHADWFHDDQPIPLRVTGETDGAEHRMVTVPYSIELNDVPVFLQHYDTTEFTRMVIDQFDVLYEEGAESGKVMCLAIHPYLMGMPHRVDELRRMFDHILSRDAVWQPTAAEIADHFIEHHYDDFVAHAQQLQTVGGAGNA